MVLWKGCDWGFGDRVLENPESSRRGACLNQAVGESPEWEGLGLVPEPMERVWVGTFRRLSWIQRGTGKKGDSEMGRAWVRAWSGF